MITIGNCKDCKHYEPHARIDKSGYCEKIEVVPDGKNDSIIPYYYECDCMVGENFGCIKFEQK